MLYIFDKDNTLARPIEKADGKTRPANNPMEQRYYGDVLPKTDLLKFEGHTLAVASNQGGVAFGIMTPEMADLMVEHAARYIQAAAWRVCYHHPKGKLAPYNQESTQRKPAPGMLISLMGELGFRPEQTVMVGDSPEDAQAAANAGCLFMFADMFFERHAHPPAAYLWNGGIYRSDDGLVSPRKYLLPAKVLHMPGSVNMEGIQAEIVGVDRGGNEILIRTCPSAYSEFAALSLETAKAYGMV